MSEMKEGTVVEVSSEANGVCGIWYEANVLKSPGGSENQTLYLVEFQNPQKSVKHVSSSFIRPKPPTPHTQTQLQYEVDDVVDVYFNDGWCIGKVVQQSEGHPTPYYSVLLDFYSQVINFNPSQLRHHMDLVDLTWVKRQKEVSISHVKKEEDIEDTGSVSTELDSLSVNVDNSCGPDDVKVDVINEDLNLQFLKDSEVMKLVESMEVFKSLPQKPHFRPLLRCSEVKREALAVAHMLTFANIVKDLSSLEITSPSSEFDSLLDCLSELELHGFDVERVRNRILQLKALKENREWLISVSRKIECKINECTQEKMDFQADLDVLTDNLNVLREKKKTAAEKTLRHISTKIEGEIEIAVLESSVGLLQLENEETRHLFRNVAAAPAWRR